MTVTTLVRFEKPVSQEELALIQKYIYDNSSSLVSTRARPEDGGFKYDWASQEAADAYLAFITAFDPAPSIAKTV